MFAGVPGWDLPGSALKMVKPGGNISQQPGRCAAACSRTRNCVGFSLGSNRCYLKKNAGKTASYKQASSTGKWTWLYVKSGASLSMEAVQNKLGVAAAAVSGRPHR